MSNKVLKSTFVIGLMTLISRISGLVRDNVFAQTLGSSLVADVFFVAFRIPNFFRRLFGEGAFSAAFVPVFSDYQMNHDAPTNRRFLELVSGRLALILLVVCVVGVVSAPLLVSVIAYGYRDDPTAFALTVDATRIMFPYLFFISLVALSAGIMNTRGRFAAPALTPVILNLCLISGAWFLAKQFEHASIALALSVILAGILQLGFQLPFLKKEGLLVQPRVRATAEDKLAIDGAKRVYKLTLPALFGVSIAQINMLVNTVLATFLSTGSIAWLYYSDRLMEFPVGIFGIALGTAILPKLSKDHASSSTQEFAQTLDWACRWVALIALPAMAALIVLGEPMVITLYHYGAFTDADVGFVYRALVAFSVGLVAIILVKVLAPGFFAREDTRTPVRVGAMAMGVNVVFSLLLFRSLAHVGLALSTSIAAIVNAAALFFILKRDGVLQFQAGWLLLLIRVVLATVVMSVLLWQLKGDMAQWLGASAWWRFGVLMSLVLGGGAIYAVTLLISGARPRHFMSPGQAV